MTNRPKIAVTLPADLLEQVERLRERTEESRSAVVVRALQLLLRHAERQLKAREYVAKYQAMPESEEDVDRAHDHAKQLLAQIPWE